MSEKLEKTQGKEEVVKIKPLWDVVCDYLMYFCLLLGVTSALWLRKMEEVSSCFPTVDTGAYATNNNLHFKKEILTFSNSAQSKFVKQQCTPKCYPIIIFSGIAFVIGSILFLGLSNLWYGLADVGPNIKAFVDALKKYKDVKDREKGKEILDIAEHLLALTGDVNFPSENTENPSKLRRDLSDKLSLLDHENLENKMFTEVESERKSICNDRQVPLMYCENLKKLTNKVFTDIQSLRVSIRGNRHTWYLVLILFRFLCSLTILAVLIYGAYYIGSVKDNKQCEFLFYYGPTKNSITCFLTTKKLLMSIYVIYVGVTLIYTCFTAWGVIAVCYHRCVFCGPSISFSCKQRKQSCERCEYSKEFSFFWYLLRRQKPLNWDYLSTSSGKPRFKEGEQVIKTDIYYSMENCLVIKKDGEGIDCYEISAREKGIPSLLFLPQVDEVRWRLIIKGLRHLKQFDLLGFDSFKNLEGLEISHCDEVSWSSLRLNSIKYLSLKHIGVPKNNKEYIKNSSRVVVKIKMPKLIELTFIKVHPFSLISVLSMESLTTLHIANTLITSLEFLGKLDKLEKLILMEGKIINNNEGWPRLKLKSLNSLSLEDIEMLKVCSIAEESNSYDGMHIEVPEVEEISFINVRPFSFISVLSIETVTRLHVSNTWVDSFKFLEKLEQLGELKLIQVIFTKSNEGWPRLRLKSLNSLSLGDVKMQKECSIAEESNCYDGMQIELPKEEEIYFINVRPFSFISVLSIETVTRLHVSNTWIASFKFLEKLEQLGELKLIQVMISNKREGWPGLRLKSKSMKFLYVNNVEMHKVYSIAEESNSYDGVHIEVPEVEKILFVNVRPFSFISVLSIETVTRLLIADTWIDSFKFLEKLEKLGELKLIKVIISNKREGWPRLKLKSLNSISLEDIEMHEVCSIAEESNSYDGMQIEVPEVEEISFINVRPFSFISVLSIETVTRLLIANTLIASFNFLEKLGNLEHFVFSSVPLKNTLSVWSSRVFNQLSSLKVTNCGLLRIPDISSETLTNIDLWGNRIGERNENLCEVFNVPKLTLLDLRNNKIKALGEKLLARIPSCKIELDLNPLDDAFLLSDISIRFAYAPKHFMSLLLGGDNHVEKVTENSNLDFPSFSFKDNVTGVVIHHTDVADKELKRNTLLYLACICQCLYQGKLEDPSFGTYNVYSAEEFNRQWRAENSTEYSNSLCQLKGREFQFVRVFLVLKASDKLEVIVTELAKILRELQIKEGCEVFCNYCVLQDSSTGSNTNISHELKRVFRAVVSAVPIKTGSPTLIWNYMKDLSGYHE